MKKLISFVLAAAMSAMVAVPAFAVDAETKKDDGANTWTTSGQNAAYAGKMMTMVAYAPGTDGAITVDSIQYIDQTTADQNGAYEFKSYIPKNLPTESAYPVKVGGETLDAAISAGEIEKIEITEVPITGTITTQSDAANATISFCTPGTTEVVVSADTTKGAFEANVAPGTYDVVISRPGYLKYTITNVEVTETLALNTVAMKAGDVDKDNNVTVSDVSAVVAGYGLSSAEDGYKIDIDFDADNNITVSDVSAVVANYGVGATTVDFADFNK